MSYCTVDDVCSEFPSFQRNAAGDIQDSQIQDWIDDAAAQIAAALVQRGFDPDAPPQPLTTRQTNLLRSMNRAAGVAKLGSVLAARVTLQTGEPAIVTTRAQSLEKILDAIRNRAFDGVFGVASQFGGIAGGEVADTETLFDEGLSNFFGKFENTEG